MCLKTGTHHTNAHTHTHTRTHAHTHTAVFKHVTCPWSENCPSGYKVLFTSSTNTGPHIGNIGFIYTYTFSIMCLLIYCWWAFQELHKTMTLTWNKTAFIVKSCWKTEMTLYVNGNNYKTVHHKRNQPSLIYTMMFATTHNSIFCKCLLSSNYFQPWA